MKMTTAFVFAYITFFQNTVLAAVNPSTGDDGNYLLWLGLLIIFAVAIIRIIMLLKKK